MTAYNSLEYHTAISIWLGTLINSEDNSLLRQAGTSQVAYKNQ